MHTGARVPRYDTMICTRMSPVKLYDHAAQSHHICSLLVRRVRHITVHAPLRVDQPWHAPFTCALACHVMRHWEQTHLVMCHAPVSLPAMLLVKVNLPPGPCSPCASPHVRGKKYKSGSQAARGVASVRSAPSKRHIAHMSRARVCDCELGRFFPLKYNFKFHLSSYVGQGVTFSLFQHSMFQTPNFKHRYLIHFSSVLDVFSSLRSSSNIEHKLTNKYIKTPQFLYLFLVQK
ncbi:hypothetical protein Hanom_Chr06g00550541 [Helianthus anomalus]